MRKSITKELKDLLNNIYGKDNNCCKYTTYTHIIDLDVKKASLEELKMIVELIHSQCRKINFEVLQYKFEGDNSIDEISKIQRRLFDNLTIRVFKFGINNAWNNHTNLIARSFVYKYGNFFLIMCTSKEFDQLNDDDMSRIKLIIDATQLSHHFYFLNTIKDKEMISDEEMDYYINLLPEKFRMSIQYRIPDSIN